MNEVDKLAVLDQLPKENQKQSGRDALMLQIQKLGM